MAFWKLATGTPPSFFPENKFSTTVTFNFFTSAGSSPGADWSSVGSVPTPGDGWFWSDGTDGDPFAVANTGNYVSSDA